MTKQGFGSFVNSNMQKMPSPRRSAFTLVEVVVILVIIALMMMIVIPMAIIGRKRSKARHVLDDLTALNIAVQQYSVDTGKGSGFNPNFQDLRKYLNKTTYVYKSGGTDILGNKYGPFIVDIPPKVPGKTYLYFNNVVEDAYWSIFR